LAVRERSIREIRDRLRRAGFDDADVDDAVDRLISSGLLDDERFARAVVRQEVTVRMAGRRAVGARLFARGVPREVVGEALEGLGDEEARADALAASRAGRLRGLDPDVAFRRLVGFLARRGYAPSTARAAASRALGLGPEDS